MTIFQKVRNKISSTDCEYIYDESRLAGGNADRIFFPENIEEISDVVKHCREQSIPFTIYGKGTGITGGCVPFGGFVISLEKLNRIGDLGYDEAKSKFFLEVQAAVTLTEIKDFLQKKGYSGICEDELTYPVDPTEMSASIGGTVATNASGASSFKYGATRNYVKSLKIVLPDGKIVKINRGESFADDSGFVKIGEKRFAIPDIKMPECKNAAGFYSKEHMDLIDIFIGSEGVLGIVAGVEIWLEKKHPSISVIKFLQNSRSAFQFVSELKKHKYLHPLFIEYIDECGLEMLRIKKENDRASINIPEIDNKYGAAVFFDILLDSYRIDEVCKMIMEIEHRINADDNFSWCGWENIEIERIKAFRHALPETVNTLISEIKKTVPEIHKLGTDMAVPEEAFEIFSDFYLGLLKKSGLKYVIFGHIGDNHLHINIIPENTDQLKAGYEIYKTLAKKAVEFKGTVSAEHGIGKIKHSYLIEMYGENGVNEMKRVKVFFDPEFLLNRNNMFKCGEKS